MKLILFLVYFTQVIVRAQNTTEIELITKSNITTWNETIQG